MELTGELVPIVSRLKCGYILHRSTVHTEAPMGIYHLTCLNTTWWQNKLCVVIKGSLGNRNSALTRLWTHLLGPFLLKDTVAICCLGCYSTTWGCLLLILESFCCVYGGNALREFTSKPSELYSKHLHDIGNSYLEKMLYKTNVLWFTNID